MKKPTNNSRNPKMQLLENKLRKMVREELLNEATNRPVDIVYRILYNELGLQSTDAQRFAEKIVFAISNNKPGK